MGLDMYLKATIDLRDAIRKKAVESFQDDAKKIHERCREFEKQSLESLGIHPNLCNHTGAYYLINRGEISVGYWRKANQIHRWFVDNVQDGKDDCGEYRVSEQQVESLKSLCQKVLKERSLAAELLPTKDGFFFGGLEIEDYYFEQLQHTIEIMDRALIAIDHHDGEISYSSSW